MIKKIRDWLRRHWFIMIKRPTNGHASLDELNFTLEQIEGNRLRICTLVEKMSEDNDAAKKAVKDHVNSYHRLES